MKYLSIKSLLIVTILALLISANFSCTQNNNRFWVSVLRADGILVPFAMYYEGNWSNPWPDPSSLRSNQLEMDIKDLSEIPKVWFGQNHDISTTWHLYLPNEVIKTLEIIKPVLFEAHCEANWGLLSNYPEKIEGRGSPVPKIGIALNAKKDVKRLIAFNESTAEWKKIISFIEPVFNKLEEEALIERIETQPIINGRLKSTGHPISSSERKKIKMSMKLYCNESAVNGKNIYYIEAEKKYKPPFVYLYYYEGDTMHEKAIPFDEEPCHGISFLNGWILKNQKGELSFLDKNLDITDCDKKGTITHFPLGVLTIKDRIFLIVETQGWESESYSIIEVLSSGLHDLISTYGGGC
jgi:hypothetical protein